VTFADERYLLVSRPDNRSRETTCAGNDKTSLQIIYFGERFQLLSQVLSGRQATGENIHTGGFIHEMVNRGTGDTTQADEQQDPRHE
jgi:hypothetical protein